MKRLARRPTASVYARSSLDPVGVAKGNAVTTALRALDGRKLVVRRGRVWGVADPFLRRWSVRKEAEPPEDGRPGRSAW